MDLAQLQQKLAGKRKREDMTAGMDAKSYASDSKIEVEDKMEPMLDKEEEQKVTQRKSRRTMRGKHDDDDDAPFGNMTLEAMKEALQKKVQTRHLQLKQAKTAPHDSKRRRKSNLLTLEDADQLTTKLQSMRTQSFGERIGSGVAGAKRMITSIFATDEAALRDRARRSQSHEDSQRFVDSYLVKSNTKKWELGTGKYGTLSYVKMQAAINQKHPRIFKDGETHKIPLSIDTGDLSKAWEKKIQGMDQLGIGMSIYFKLLKSMIYLLLVSFVMYIPLMAVYSTGLARKQINGDLQQLVSRTFLGNIGEYSHQCAQVPKPRANTVQEIGGPQHMDSKDEDDVSWLQGHVFRLRCPPGQYFKKIIKFGIGKPEDNQCPQSSFSGTIKLNLEDDCSLDAWETDYEEDDYHTRIKDVFKRNCLDDQNGKCEIKLDDENLAWPEGCRTKLDQKDKYFAFAQFDCNDQHIDLGFAELKREQLGIMVAVVDLMVMSSFLIALYLWKHWVRLDSQRHRNLLFETQEFSVFVWGLPTLGKNYKIENLKVDLQNHIIENIKHSPQQIEALKDTPGEQQHEIIDTHFGMSDYQYLHELITIKKFARKVDKIEKKVSRQGISDKKILIYEARRNGYLERLNQAKQTYYNNIENMGKDNQAVCAMVTFRSMEGAQRALNEFRYSRFWKYLYSICTCLIPSRMKKKLLHNNWINVTPAVDPELLLWENFGVRGKQKCIRVAVYLLYMFTLLIGCFYGILYLENHIAQKEKTVLNVQCPEGKKYSKSDELLAKEYWDNRDTPSNVDYHCFCKWLSDTEGYEGVRDYLFPQDNIAHCLDWYNDYWGIFWGTLAIAGTISLINILSEVFIQLGSDFTRPVNYTWNIIDVMKGIAWIQFINLGLVLLIISLKLEFQSSSWTFIKNPTGFMKGKYQDFSSAWFLDTGYQIVFYMALEIVIPHVLPAAQLIYWKCRKIRDRGCCKDSTNSRKFIQSDYERIYTGPEFNLDSRLAQIIVFTWVTYMYALGMPVLFLVSAINFTIMYWIDKWLVLRFYRLPRNYDETTINSTLAQLNYAFLFHLIIGFLMISNNNLLTTAQAKNHEHDQQGVPTSNSDESSGVQSRNDFAKFFTAERFRESHTLIFVVGNLTLILCIIFKSSILKCLSKHCPCMRKMQQKMMDMEAISDDYYDEIHLKFLINEYERSRLEQCMYLQFMDKLKADQQKLAAEQAPTLTRGHSMRPKGSITGKHQKRADDHLISLNQHIKRQIEKAMLVQRKLKILCKQLNIDEPSHEEQIRQLTINEEKLQQQRESKMKSKVQTYDLRDSHEYNGVFELQKLLHSSRDSKAIDFTQIRRAENLLGRRNDGGHEAYHDDSFTSSLESDEDAVSYEDSGSSKDLNEIKEESDEDSFGEDKSMDEHEGLELQGEGPEIQGAMRQDLVMKLKKIVPIQLHENSDDNNNGKYGINDSFQEDPDESESIAPKPTTGAHSKHGEIASKYSMPDPESFNSP